MSSGSQRGSDGSQRESDRSEGESRVSRRSFLRYGAVAGAAAAAVPTGLAAGSRGREEEPGAAGAGPEARDREPGGGPDTGFEGDVPSFALEGATIGELQERMGTGEMSAVDVAEAYLGRIEALDRRGPTLRHVLELNPDALSIARELDRERKEQGPRGPMHGIPVLLKDNVDTGDRMSTSAGSLALHGRSAPRDAFLVRQLREAGAVILGKANLSEWANFRSTESTSGWSARGGQGRNPYALDRNPCGSSSGSAAAVAASYVPVSVGTETNGSIMCPASVNSCAAVKPTVGRVSRSGIVPISHTQDTAGPFATTVRDAAILLGAMSGVDPRDEATEGSRGRDPEDFTGSLDVAGLEGARIGVPREDLSGFTAESDRVFDDVLAALEDAGAELVDPADVPRLGEYGSEEFTVLLYEFKADLNRYLRQRGTEGAARSLETLIRFNEENREREMPYFGQEIFERAQEKGSLESEEYREALDKILRLSREEGIDAAFEEHDLDAMVAMTTAPAWPIDLVNGDRGHGSSYSPWAIAGYPGVTVPAGYVFGLPVGVSFYGRAWEEPRLLRYAYAFEQATKARELPSFRPHARVPA